MDTETVGVAQTSASADKESTFSRRTVLAGGLAVIIATARPTLARPVNAASLAELEHRHGGRLGVYALDLQSNRTLAYRADERFKLMSSFKALLTAMVLREVVQHKESLDAPVRYGPADLMAASPVTQANVARGAMSVREMCEAAMYQSDNAAANLLMRRLGGPPRVTAFVRGIGDPITRIDNYEGHLTDQPLPADSTTPRSIIETARRIMLGQVLPTPAQSQWERWMEGNIVGKSRLRAAFPGDWASGDRTGTGDGICNDFAFARRPGRAPLLLSAYYTAPGMEMAAQEAVLRDVARLVVAWQG